MSQYCELNCENFQDLGLWCSVSTSVDCFMTDNTMTVENTDWITSTPVHSPLEQSSFFSTTSPDVLTCIAGDTFSYCSSQLSKEMSLDAELFDIADIPIVLAQEDGTYEDINTTNSNNEDINTANSNNNESIANLKEMKVDTLPQNETSSNCISSFTRVDNKTVISGYIVNQADQKIKIKSDILLPYKTSLIARRHKDKPLQLDFKDLADANDQLEPTIATPEVLNFVEEMEAEKFGHFHRHTFRSLGQSPQPSTSLEPTQHITQDLNTGLSLIKEEPIDSDEEQYDYTPARKRRRRRSSQDSDETYVPHRETTPARRTKRSAAPTLVSFAASREGRRRRPPKRRESVASVSTLSTADDAASCLSAEDVRYRELRDKNNVASKRSRMHRKAKEKEMVKLAENLEESNKMLRVRVDVLEQLTEKVKAALFAAMLGK